MVWGTDLKAKYKHDVGFTTNVKISSYLLIFTSIVLGCAVLAGYIQYELLVRKLQPQIPEIKQLAEDSSGIIFLLFLVVVIFSALGTFLALSKLTVNPLRNAFALQKRFVSGIAHELRTPLSVLRINNEIARFGAKTGSELASLCDENMGDIDKIDEMLNTILLFDRMLSAESLQFQPVDIRKLLYTVNDRLAVISAQKQVKLTFALAEIPLLSANQVALEQAFFNVLENAITFTPAGDEIVISSDGVQNSYVLITITDTGPGIETADVPHIFEPFYRNEKTGKLSGTGIGLAITQEIMRLHKGTIKVTENTKTGATFTFCLPADTP